MAKVGLELQKKFSDIGAEQKEHIDNHVHMCKQLFAVLHNKNFI